MKCPKCQTFNRAEAKFCEECAAPLARTCAKCGHQLSPSAKFCPECACPTVASANLQTSGPDQSPFGSPDTYTPKHLARRILGSKAALEGERKQVTVLFADLKGSMELLADRDPEEARKLLDPVIEHLMEAVHHYEGTVSQVAGDGIMALFGAPLAHEDHAVRACYAALRMQERVKRHAEGVFHAHGANLEIRVGLNSGEVVVRSIGSDLHMDYSAIGRTTHLASRMEQLAKPGSILLTPSTLELAEGFITAKPLGAVPIKGLSDPLEVHEVTGVGPARSRLEAVARRGLTQFVGRDAELEQLWRVLARARDGHGQVAAVVAEPGVGKSRLVYELAHVARQEGWQVLECTAASYGKAMSYLPVLDLLKGYFEIKDRDNLQAIGDKVTGKLLALDPALAPALPALLALLGVPVNDAAWQTLDPARRRRRMLDAVRHVLLREARKQPLLLVFEDLHWIDGESQALLDGIVESLASARILLLATYRPEYQHGWGGKTCYSQTRLDALPAESASKLLDALLGDDAALAPLKQLLVRRGNPFFLEESVRTLVETKALAGAPGHHRLTRSVETIQVPATVQVMLSARIDRLSLEDKRLLQVAAVIGRRVPVALLLAVAGLPDEVLGGALDRLQAAEFVYETGAFADLEYNFKHALTQDIAYGSILQERRRELHARIVEAIETLHHDRLGEQVELLAHHAARGELHEKAVSFLFQAGMKAARHSAPRSAQTSFGEALDLLKGLPDNRSRLEQSFEIRLELHTVLRNLGKTRKALQRLREAEALAETLNDERGRGRVCALMASLNCLHGELDDALDNGARALTIAERMGDSASRIETETHLTMVHYYRCEYERVVTLATATLEAMVDGLVYYAANVPGPIYVQRWLVRSLSELGRFAEADPLAHEMVRLAEATHSGYAIGMAQVTAGWCQLAKGDWAQARPLVERAQARPLVERGVAEYRKGNISLSLPHAVASSALVLARVGEASEASSRLREGEELLGRRIAGGTIDQAGMDYHWLGRAALVLGRLDDARRLADCALQYSPSHPGYAAHALHLLGDLATHFDQFDADQGEAHYRKALTLANPFGMRPLIAHCHLGLGKLYRRTDREKQTRDHLATATTMYREMDMRFWLEQAEAKMRQLT
jgi:class 3 adenylate cyclase/tetratricopeptide (TPR) repeat protein